MLKFLVAAIILFLFRNELRALAPYWITLAAVGAGLAVGLWYAGLFEGLGLLGQAGRGLGISPRAFKILVLIVGAVGGLKVFGPFIRSLFPDERRKK